MTHPKVSFIDSLAASRTHGKTLMVTRTASTSPDASTMFSMASAESSSASESGCRSCMSIGLRLATRFCCLNLLTIAGQILVVQLFFRW